jgi:hypothetical protein
MISTPFRVRFLGASLATLLALVASAQEQQQPAPPAPRSPAEVRAALLRATAERYAAASWATGARRVGLALGAIELRGYRGGDVECNGALPLQRRFADASGEARVLLEVLVGERVADAREQLLGWLANVSRPGLVPASAGEGIPVGDAAFVGWSKPAERRIAWLAFVRDNVAVRVVCLDPRVDPHPDLAAIAQQVDAAIGREALAGEAALPRPRIARFAAARARCRAGDDVALELAVTDADDGAAAPALRFDVDGAGQGHVDTDERGQHRLRTTGAGAVTVRVTALGARGVAATATLTVDVQPR